ncbi:hypothetical protein Q1695_013606 [Nippostrongylus brasiliensis]|nr:hypothetical protein Q1695_013606 [Nippostrongylus brasiliensis]
MYRYVAPIRLRRLEARHRRLAQMYIAAAVVTLVAIFCLMKTFGIIGGRFSEEKNAPQRRNMKPCQQRFGHVTIFVMKNSNDKSMKSIRASLECYAKGNNYKLLVVDVDKDEKVKSFCANHQALKFKRHCAVAAYLDTTDWMLVVDDETGVVNPQHCIEEWIDNSVDILLYEKLQSWEISSSSYLVRNSDFSREFLLGLAKWEFRPIPAYDNDDQGAMMLHLLRLLLPDAVHELRLCTQLWAQSINFQTYEGMVMCVRQALGAQRIWPEKIRIYRKMHGWNRAAWVTKNFWSDADFMLQGWNQDVSHKANPFQRNFNLTECDSSLKAWNWKTDLYMDKNEFRNALLHSEEHYRNEFPNKGRLIIYLEKPEISSCYPDCEKQSRMSPEQYRELIENAIDKKNDAYSGKH